MLKVTAPIQLNTRAPMISAGEGFCQRMNANYDMISMQVSPEALLHITTQPPEFYFGEGGQSYIDNDTTINITEKNTANIINNLINRIMVEPSFGLMYQDKVYISNALRKLGIRDEQTFMNQVYAMREEISHTNELINMYFAYGDNIKSLVSEYSQTDVDKSKQTTENTQEILHLHEEILNRLQTASIYNIVENFQENAYGAEFISTNEMMIAEQKKVFENILLRELQSEARGEKLPLVYKSENYYENFDFTEENATDENITRIINTASLLNLISNAIETKSAAVTNNINNWYEVSNRAQSISQNTLLRLESNIKNEGVSNVFNANAREVNNKILENEINLISQIIKEENTFDTLSEINLSYDTHEETNVENEQRLFEENIKQENQKNIENRILFEQTIARERESVQKKLSDKERKERQRTDSLNALKSPEEVILSLRQEQALADENEERINRVAAQRTLDSEDQIINLITQYIENPTTTIPGAIITQDDFGTLAGDIEQVELSHRQINKEITDNFETIERVTKEVSKELRTEENIPVTSRTFRETLTNLNLTHKTTESLDFEEVTEQLMEQNRWLYEHTKQTDNIITNQNIDRTNVVNENVYDHTEINRNIEELVNNTVTSSMNTFSDKVFRQIENKLELEKRRRGL